MSYEVFKQKMEYLAGNCRQSVEVKNISGNFIAIFSDGTEIHGNSSTLKLSMKVARK